MFIDLTEILLCGYGYCFYLNASFLHCRFGFYIKGIVLLLQVWHLFILWLVKSLIPEYIYVFINILWVETRPECLQWFNEGDELHLASQGPKDTGYCSSGHTSLRARIPSDRGRQRTFPPQSVLLLRQTSVEGRRNIKRIKRKEGNEIENKRHSIVSAEEATCVWGAPHV